MYNYIVFTIVNGSTDYNKMLCLQSLVRELGSQGAFSEELDRDSGNIVQLVRDSYNVSQSITLHN